MITVDVIVSEELIDLFPLECEDVQKYSSTVLKAHGLTSCDINVVFIGDEKMTELNEKYKKHEGTTDVLSFNLSDNSTDIVEGEIYVSLKRAEKQAAECSVPLKEEIIRLVTHGLLHLAGRTHKSEQEYRSMMTETENFVKDFFRDGASN